MGNNLWKKIGIFTAVLAVIFGVGMSILLFIINKKRKWKKNSPAQVQEVMFLYKLMQ